MKIESLKNKILNIILKASRLTSNKNLNLPILNCLILESKNNRLFVKATNLEIGATFEIPVKTEIPGIVAVPGEILSNLISNLPEGNNLKLESQNGELKIKTDKNQTVIKTKNPDDYPSIPESKTEPFVVSNNDFMNGLKSVWYSSSVSAIKPELSSIYIYVDDGYLIFAATDSFRLAEKRLKIKDSKGFDKVLIPFKNALEISRIIEGEDDDLFINLDKNQIFLVSGSVKTTSRIVDGNFPDYKQIIPKEFKTEVTVLKQDLINAFKIANVFSDKTNQVNLKVDNKNKKFKITTKNSDVGENVSEIDSVFEGEDIEINFNLKYITDCLSSINSDSLTLSFSDISRPMIIRGVSDKSFLYLVMPMNK